ncbi:MAG TPA: PAS domain S-box protein [Candidatus Binatia bacterium]|jgi:two-component system cell cycle sensor histidine kinase/response regulator CckA|nr:PAS domain S-box protein [Candidatus Binatia bacterium]
MTEPVQTLLVEDSTEDAILIARELQRDGLEVACERVDTAAAMQAALELKTWQLIISDYSMPGFDGAAALKLYQQRGLDIPFIIVSGAIGEERAVEIIKAGAHDYVAKDKLVRLGSVVKRELGAAQERRIRRQAEATAGYLASLVGSCDDAIIGKTLDGIVVTWNAGAERLYGYQAAEMIGASITRVISPERPEQLLDILARNPGGGQVEHYETVRVRKDKRKVEVSLTISPIKDDSGRVIGVSSVERDITTNKQQENERLALIQDLTAALARLDRLQTPAGTRV